MSTSSGSHRNDTNIWFGVSMVLIGIIIGFVFAVTSGRSFNFGMRQTAQVPSDANNAPAAPSNVPSQAGETGTAKMVRIVGEIGLDTNAFASCLTTHKFAQKVADDEAAGQKAGIDGTPGSILYNRKTKTAWLISGARPLSSFQSAIDDMIKNPAGKPSDPSITVATNVVPVDVATEHVRGNAQADIALIEYADYQCPFCQRVHPTLQQVMQKYGDKIMWVYRQFPLPPTMHPDAESFAEGSECVYFAGGNEAFWKFTDKMFE